MRLAAFILDVQELPELLEVRVFVIDLAPTLLFQHFYLKDASPTRREPPDGSPPQRPPVLSVLDVALPACVCQMLQNAILWNTDPHKHPTCAVEEQRRHLPFEKNLIAKTLSLKS